MVLNPLSSKAQAGLEYLVTYGWALIIIATIIGVMVFIISPPTETLSFSSSVPGKILVKGNSTDGGQVTVLLQNATGGRITVTDVDLKGSFGFSPSVFLNDVSISDNGEYDIVILAGGELLFAGINYSGSGSGTINMDYTDIFELEQSVVITGLSSGEVVSPPSPTEICNNSIDDDGDGDIDCADEDCDGLAGPGGGTCEYGTEYNCSDSFDNDADSLPDCDDSDCFSDYSCDVYGYP